MKECDLATLREDCQSGFIPSNGGLAFAVNTAFMMNVSTRSKDLDLPVFYLACPTCNRKLQTDDRCMSCDKHVSNPNARFLLRAQFSDFSDDCYLSVFHDQALALLNSANPRDFTENAADKRKTLYLKKIFNLKVRATASEYKGEIKPKINVVHAELTDFRSDAHRMLKLLNAKIGEPALIETRKRKIDQITDENQSMLNDSADFN